jgi:hypothetical protein
MGCVSASAGGFCGGGVDLALRFGRGLFPGLQAMSIGFMIDAADPNGNIAKVYKQIARRIAVKVADMAQDHSAIFPKIVLQNT